MPGRNKPLITRNGIPDPQAYNPQTGQWESFVGVSWGKTAGGLYVPIRVDDQGRQEVTLSGTVAKLIAYDKKMWDELTNYLYGIAGVGSSGIFSAVDHQQNQIIDISEFNEISILIINNLDKALENQVGAMGLNGKVVFSTLPKTHPQILSHSYRMSHKIGDYIVLDAIPAGARLSLKLTDMAPYQSLAVMVRDVSGASAGSLEIMIGGGLK